MSIIDGNGVVEKLFRSLSGDVIVEVLGSVLVIVERSYLG